MTKTNYQSKRKFIEKEKKLEKIHYSIIVGLAIFGIIYYYFIQPITLGYDSRYIIYIVILPFVIGMIILGLYRRHFLLYKFVTNRGIVLWTFLTFFYLTQGVIFSYLSFGQLAKISWDVANTNVVNQNKEESFDCKITRFWKGRNPTIDFIFKNSNERLRVNYSFIKEYENKDKNDYVLKLKATRGLWNYYRLNEWKIEHK